ncbi:MAG: hypothetical protein VKO64_03440 [Candidatus Sericytochromatia bacterium]|nr:hypothetical protein [Candidatus Sericytochromatia bacterium]
MPRKAGVQVSLTGLAAGTATLLVTGERLAPRVKVEGRTVQGLDLNQVSSVRVSIVGAGQFDLPAVVAPVVDGQFSVSLSGLVPGPRRVVEAVGLDAEGRDVPGAVLAAIVDVAREGREVRLAWSATALARMVGEIHRRDRSEGRQRVASLDLVALQGKLDAALAAGLHGSFVDHVTWADRILASGGSHHLSGQVEVPLHKPSALVVGVRGLGPGEELLLRIHDPASLPYAGMDNGAFALGPILPGTWRVWLSAPGRADRVVVVPFAAGATVSMEVDVTVASAVGGDFGGPEGLQTPAPVPYPSGFDWSAWAGATPVPLGTLPPASPLPLAPSSTPAPYQTPVGTPVPIPPVPGPSPTSTVIPAPGNGGGWLTPTPFAPPSPTPSLAPIETPMPAATPGAATPEPSPTMTSLAPGPGPMGNATITIKVRFDE